MTELTFEEFCELRFEYRMGITFDTGAQRTWVGLTDDERSELVTLHHGWNEYGQAIEAKLKQKNGYAEEKSA